MSAPVIGGAVLLLCLSSSAAAYLMGSGEETISPTGPTGPTGPAGPGEYKYDFIVIIPNEATASGTRITQILVDGKRIQGIPEIEVELHDYQDACKSKSGGYECGDDAIGAYDPEPGAGGRESDKDLSWTEWNKEEPTKIMTITSPTKISKFQIDFQNPRFMPGFRIKENGVKVYEDTENGGTSADPSPKRKTYEIP
jgi:hypothetical protein